MVGQGSEGREKEIKPPGTMPKDYMIQMTAMMVMANLYNSSSGRNAKYTAKVAMDAAKALYNEWIKG